MKCLVQLFHPVVDNSVKGVDEFLKPIMSSPIEFTSTELQAIRVFLSGGVAQGLIRVGSPGDSARIKVSALCESWGQYVKANS